jgi:hypothetical protein
MASDFEMMEKSARKMAAQVKAAEGRAAKAAAKKAAADRLATIATQRGMSGPAATAMLGRVIGAAGLAITAAEIARALREKGKTQKERVARGTRIAKEAEKMAVKPKSGQSPTDAMRANMTGRVTTGTSRKLNTVKATPTAPIQSPTKKPKQTPKQTFGQAFAAARKAGKKEFMYNGKPYHTRTKEEEAAKAKPTIKAKPQYTGPRAEMVNKLLKQQTTKKSYGGSMGKKTTKKASGGKVASKPKGVGCATRGYGKAMK